MREVECLYNMSELTVRIDGDLQPVDADYPVVDEWAETSEYLQQAIDRDERPLVVLMFEDGPVVAEVTRLGLPNIEQTPVSQRREGTIGLKPSEDLRPLDDLLTGAIASDHIADFVRTLDRRGPGVNVDKLLMDAANYGRVEFAKLLIDGGANVNVGNANGWTPSHVAAAHGFIAFLRLLVDAGATQSPDRSGETPLMAARREGQHEAARLLSTLP